MLWVLCLSDAVGVKENRGVWFDDHLLAFEFKLGSQTNGQIGDDGQQMSLCIENKRCAMSCIAVAHQTCRQVEDSY